MSPSQAFAPRRRTAAIADIEAVADGLRDLRQRLSRFGPDGPGASATIARQDLVDELLDYLEDRRVR